MRKLRITPFAALLAVPVFVWADSGVGVDTWRANKLDPTGGQATEALDPNGTSWLEPGEHRSPTGNLYETPTQEPHPDNLSVWLIYGTFDIGYLHTSGEKTALFDRYTRWPTNGPAFDFDVNAERPSDGSYAEVARQPDQRRGSILRSRVWQSRGVQSRDLRARHAESPVDRCEIDLQRRGNQQSHAGRRSGSRRQHRGAGRGRLGRRTGDLARGPSATSRESRSPRYLTPHWTVYLNVSDEERKGDRPYGGPFFFDFDNIGGAILETIKPIDDSTINITAGVRYAGSEWRFDFGYSGSIYRDRLSVLLTSSSHSCWGRRSCPERTSSPITQGQMSMEPNNNYHNLHVTATRLLPMNGEALADRGRAGK